MKISRSILKGIALLGLSTSLVFPAMADSNDEAYQKYQIYNMKAVPNIINITVDAVYQDVSVPPYVQNGRTLVPVRIVAEGLKCKVNWDTATKTVTIVSEDESNVIIAKQDSQAVTVNGVEQTLDVPVSYKSGRLFVPLRFISETFNCLVVSDLGEYYKEIKIITPSDPSYEAYKNKLIEH